MGKLRLTMMTFLCKVTLWMWQSENSKKVLAFSTVTHDTCVICCVNWACLSWRAQISMNEILGSSCLSMTTCVHIYITLFFIDICLTGALSKVTKRVSSKVDLTWYLGTQTTGQGYSDLQLKWTTWQPDVQPTPYKSPSFVSVLGLWHLQTCM